ncbi:MAG: hypothetical protein U9N45_04495 [Gemmatimonadota bacterium]|nr:hypothetical protein [Gemmatimonadota bacterium]
MNNRRIDGRHVKNQYKRLDVFRCKLQSHDSFEGWVSAFHVLKVKRCLPDGCFYFKWRCRLLEKGATCVKGYNYPGKNCRGCRFYYEDKIHKVPVVQLSDQAYREFLDDLQDFEDWLGSNIGRRVEVYGRVNFAGPHLTKTVYTKYSKVSLRGYLINFAECFLGRTRFEDFVYLRISRKSQLDLRLARGDLLEFEAELTLDQGRLVLVRPGRFEFIERSPDAFGQESDDDLSRIIVEARTATVVSEQSERCLSCERGRLVDVIEKGTDTNQDFRRELFCLEGVREPSLCCYETLKKLGIRKG